MIKNKNIMIIGGVILLVVIISMGGGFLGSLAGPCDSCSYNGDCQSGLYCRYTDNGNKCNMDTRQCNNPSQTVCAATAQDAMDCGRGCDEWVYICQNEDDIYEIECGDSNGKVTDCSSSEECTGEQRTYTNQKSTSFLEGEMCYSSSECDDDDDCGGQQYCFEDECYTCEQDGTLCNRDGECCSDNCINDICEPAGTTCIDTEADMGRYIAGTCTVGPDTFTDYCLDSFRIQEYACQGDDLATAEWDCSDYGERCEGGICVDNPQTCTGPCKANGCSSYGGCSSGSGICTTGNCCSGDCCDIGIFSSCTIGPDVGLKECTTTGWGNCEIEQCVDDDDCTIGSYNKCLDGTCVQCITTPDCDSGYTCTNNQCVLGPGPGPTTCTTYLDCEEGLACVDGECKAKCIPLFTEYNGPEDKCEPQMIAIGIAGGILVLLVFAKKKK